MAFFFCWITFVHQFQAHVYQENVHREGLNLSLSQISNKCSAFLANIDERKAATVTFRGQTYTLPPWSVSILPDCRSAIFNTAKVSLCRVYFWCFKKFCMTSFYVSHIYKPSNLSVSLSLSLSVGTILMNFRVVRRYP